ncbi:hypothetical protein [Dethiothermospora halolimnae]|uniref:hypothetical protein n=1 Tax=Dethiothermospora halolimnae TaxID=3114390 RepID=UPI003CCC28B0
MDKKSKIALYTVIIMLFNIIFFNVPIFANNISSNKVIHLIYTDKKVIKKGDKNIDYDIPYINIKYNNSYDVDKEKLNEILITANNQYLENNKFKDFEVDKTKGIIKLSLKDSPLYGDKARENHLRLHSLYTIYIPKGLFKDGDEVIDSFGYSFVTRGQTQKENDIIKKVYPSNDSHNIDNTDIIGFNFISNISTDDIRDKIHIYKKSMIKDDYYKRDSIDSYNIDNYNDTLIVRPKSGKLNDFTQYKVILKEKAVYLKSDTNSKIYNDKISLVFYTDNFIDYTRPSNKSSNASVDENIEFHFKYPIELLDKDKITITSDGEEFAVKDKYLGDDKRTLVLDIDDNYNDKDYHLRRDTEYTVKIEKDALKLKDYKNAIENKYFYNSDIYIDFKTRGEGKGPNPIAYSSSLSMDDDIRYLYRRGNNNYSKLKPDDSIYIKFDRDIARDDNKGASIKDSVKLYRILNPKQSIYDETNYIKDKLVEFYTNGDDMIPANIDETKLEGKTSIEKHKLIEDINLYEIPIREIKIVNKDILRITPRYNLDSLMKYKIFIDKESLEDINGYNVDRDIEFSFWCDRSDKKENVEVRDVVFGDDKVTLKIDGHIRPKADDITIDNKKTYDIYSENRISYNSLNNIKILDIYNNIEQVDISKIQFRYNYYGDNKETIIEIFPKEGFGSGRYYELYIPEDTLETPHQNSLDVIKKNYRTDGNINDDNNATDLNNKNSVSVLQLYKDGYHDFSIYGYNFNESIEKVQLIPKSGRVVDEGLEKIEIDREDIEFISVNEIKVKIRGENGDKLSKEIYTGSYNIELYFDNDPKLKLPEDETFNVISKGAPHEVYRIPEDDDDELDEEELGLNINPIKIDGEDRYFIKIVYEDIDHTLEFNDDFRNGLKKIKESSSIPDNIIDIGFIDGILDKEEPIIKEYIDKYIFKSEKEDKKALFIPVKNIKSNTKYTLNIKSGIIMNDSLEKYNREILGWTFKTMAIPDFNKDDVMVKSVVEDYNYKEPIIIYGNNFSSSVNVYFDDEEAYDVKSKTDNDNNKYLEVYLPKYRLNPGLYDIYIENDNNHKKVKAGILSVVKEGEYIPKEDIRENDNNKEGMLIEKISQNETILILDDRYTNGDDIKMNLDHLMGENTLVRKIKFEDDKGDIDEFDILSKWGDIYIEDIEFESDDEDAMLQVGKVSPMVETSIRNKLIGETIISDIIAVETKDLVFDFLTVTITPKAEIGQGIIVLRYDINKRRFERVNNIDVTISNNKVEFLSYKPGIFVILRKSNL